MHWYTELRKDIQLEIEQLTQRKTLLTGIWHLVPNVLLIWYLVSCRSPVNDYLRCKKLQLEIKIAGHKFSARISDLKLID